MISKSNECAARVQFEVSYNQFDFRPKLHGMTRIAEIMFLGTTVSNQIAGITPE